MSENDCIRAGRHLHLKPVIDGASTMPEPAATSRPLLAALAATAASVLAFLMLRAAGLEPDGSLLASMTLAGVLNIRRLASLNCHSAHPTCLTAVGELAP